VGVETIGPGKKSPTGYEHGIRSTEETADPESRFYGHKVDKIGQGGLTTNQRLVQLHGPEFTPPDDNRGAVSPGWLAFLRKVEDDWKTLTNNLTGNDLRDKYNQLVGQRGDSRFPPDPDDGQEDPSAIHEVR
jgi:hypothetical protein